MLLWGIFGKEGQENGEHDSDNRQHVAPTDLALAGMVDVGISAERADQ